MASQLVVVNNDFNFTYAGIKQLCEKYLVQNRTTKKIYETPQFAYMLIAMTFFKSYKNDRINYIKKAYNYFSQHKINLPTPMAIFFRLDFFRTENTNLD